MIMNTQNIEKALARMGIEELAETHGNAGCNEMSMPDSPELRQLWDEYNAWNMNVPLDKLDKTSDQYREYPEPTTKATTGLWGHPAGTVTLDDGLTEFALRKLAGLLERKV